MLTYNEFLLENFKKPWIDELPEGTTKQELYQYVNYIANQLDEELLGEYNLGSGSNGTAFELKSGKVLKLTGDAREAKMAQWLKNHNTKYLINCYSIYEITPGSTFVLLMDKLEMIQRNLDMRLIWDNILTFINKKPHLIIDNDINYVLSKIEYDLDIEMEYEEIVKYLEDNWDSICGITAELAELDIKFPDIHTDNLGYDKNHNLIYFDVKEMKKKKRKDLSHIELEKLDISPFFKEAITI